jgi:transketolase
VPLEELTRIRELEVDPVLRTAAFADACRINLLYAIARAGSGHPGTSLSCVDILSWLHLEVLGDGDRAYSSKGHDSPATYAVLIGTGKLPFELLHRLRRLGGLPGHPDVRTMPAVHTSTGSLGMGVSKAKGFLFADARRGRTGRVYVVTGDGELQEGQFWESLGSAANQGLGGLTVIVDANQVQSDTWVRDVSDLGDLEAKFRAFGWEAARCDGNDVAAVAEALRGLDERAPDRPKALIADTVKGAGALGMEATDEPWETPGFYGFHSGAPTPEQHERAVTAIAERLNARLAAAGAEPVALVDGEARPAPAAATERAPQKLVPAYGEALADAAAREQRLVALDADLLLDTGLIPFKERFPDRFVECGIAEQDMVSQAGTMALAGLLPAVHSFGCFLSTRPNEQIYNNATEGTKVLYAGSLVGLVPGGPGHSHQSVRDIGALGAMPGMALVEPFCEAEAAALVRWAVEDAPGSVYVRLVSVPWTLPFDAPTDVEVTDGRGTVLREGADVLFVAAGPVMVSQAWLAADALSSRGVHAGVVALPWLRGVDGAWLGGVASGALVVTLDNHYVQDGQGSAVLTALHEAGAANRVLRLGVEEVPVCGTNDEVLRAHGLTGEQVAERVAAELGR